MSCRSLGRLVSKNSILFLCDIQEKFRPMIQYFDGIVECSRRIVDTARILEIPILATEQYPKGLGATVKELGLDQEPTVKPLEKMQFSMCTQEVLKQLKEQHPDVKNIILCGIEAHVCVQGTALQALEEGYDVHVVVDACSSRSMVDRMYAFERMKQAGAWLTTSESIILGLVGGASHPKFRTVQKLILKTAPDTGLLSKQSEK